MDACLSDRDCLLLHCLVNSDLIFDIHLIELINATDAVVSKHECTSFDAELSSLRVFSYTCSQTSSTACFSTRVDCSWQELADIFKELTFCCRWITYNADVDITAKF